MNDKNCVSPGYADPHFVPGWWRITVWTVSAAWALLQIPYGFGLQPYVFFDAGWALSTNALISEGLVPTRDFAFFYGLLTLVVDRLWFAMFGATPFAQAGLSLLCAVAATHAVIRFARGAELRHRARWLLLVCAPLAIMPAFYPSPTHALEHALLINALASQAGGHPAIALLLVTVCLFVKPTLASFYGPILVGVILFGHRATPVAWRIRLRELWPAAIAGLAIAGLLAAMFGVEPLVLTLIPTDGAKFDAAQNFGFFFGVGRKTWLPEPMVWWYYLFTPAGFLLVGSVVLVLGAVRTARSRRPNLAAITLTCTTLHLIFIFFLYGNELSWKYYPYLLVFGLCCVLNHTEQTSRESRAIRSLSMVWILFLLAALGQSYYLLICLAMTVSGLLSPTSNRSESTAWLLASGPDQVSWRRVRAIAARERVLILAQVSAGRILMPEVDSPRCWYLLKPIARASEIERVNDQIRAADWLVIPTGPGERLDSWPEFAESLAPFRVVEVHSTFLLARRVGAVPSQRR